MALRLDNGNIKWAKGRQAEDVCAL